MSKIKIENFDVSDDGSSDSDHELEDEEISVDVNDDVENLVGADYSDEELEVFDNITNAKKSMKTTDTQFLGSQTLNDSLLESSKKMPFNDLQKFDAVDLNASSQHTKDAVDPFNINYVPYKKREQSSNQPITDAFVGEEEFRHTIKSLTQANKKEQDTSDDEFDFEIATPIERNIDKSIEIFVPPTSFALLDSENVTISNEVSVAVNEEKFNVWSAAASSLSEIKNVYSDGLGDIEARILNSNTANVETSSSSFNPNSLIQGVNEAIIEEDEAEYEKQEMIETLRIEQTLLMQAQEASIWDNLENTKVLAKESLISKSELNNEIGECSYSNVLKYLQHLDLSVFSSLIVTSNNNEDSKQESASSNPAKWLSNRFSSLLKSKNPEISYQGSRHEIEFPFLVAQLDYNCDDVNHLGILQHIFRKLTQRPSLSTIPSLGSHWDEIGFQGLDPRTDLNRSMKMLSILMTLHMVDLEEYLSCKLFALSVFGRSNNIDKQEIRRGKDFVDLTWPFICVSVLFTKETLQTFRSGSLNSLCNERKDIISVLADFHHACFLEFGKRLVANSRRHHAMHLADMRKIIETDPLAILKSLLVLKSTKNMNAALDDLLTYKTSTIKGTVSSSANVVIEEDIRTENNFADITCDIQFDPAADAPLTPAGRTGEPLFSQGRSSNFVV